MRGLPDVVPSGAWVVLGVVFYLPILWLAWRAFRGGRYSRLVMTALVSVDQGAQMWRYLQGKRPPFSALISMTSDLLLVYALTSLSAREWTANDGGQLHECGSLARATNWRTPSRVGAAFDPKSF